MATIKGTQNLGGIKEGDIVELATGKYRYTPEGTFILENQTPSPAPTPTPTPTETGRLVRYPTEGYVAPAPATTEIDKARQALYGTEEERKLLTEGDKSKVRTDVREQFQAYLDAVNKQYNRLIQEEKQRGVSRLGRARAAASAGGTLGGSFGEAALSETERYNLELEGGLEQQRALKLEEVYAKIDDRALKEIESRQAERRGKAEAYLNYLKDVKTESESDIKELASSGVKIGNISEDRYQQLLKQSGKDPLQFESFYYSNLPANLKPTTQDITTKLPNGNAGMIRIEVDPQTGKSNTRSFDFGIKHEELFGKYPGGTKEVNGILYGIRSDGTLTPLTKKTTELKDMPTSYQEWSLSGGQTGTGLKYGEWLRRKEGSGATFKPTADEKSAVQRYISRYGDEADAKKAETDSAFFYAILDKSIGTEGFNIQPFKYPFGY